MSSEGVLDEQSTKITASILWAIRWHPHHQVMIFCIVLRNGWHLFKQYRVICIFIISKNKPHTTLHFKNKNAYCGCTEKQNSSWKTQYFSCNKWKRYKKLSVLFCEIKTFGPRKCSPRHAALKIHANVKLSNMDAFKILFTWNPINYKISAYCPRTFSWQRKS